MLVAYDMTKELNATLVLHFPCSLLDRLIDEYDKYIGSNDEEADVKAAKLGEVLVRVARQLGTIFL